MSVARLKSGEEEGSAVAFCRRVGLGAAERASTRALSRATSQTNAEANSSLNAGFSFTRATAFGEISQA